jgi:hypothetical protein
MIRAVRRASLVVFAALGFGCGTEPAPQIVSGHANLSTFPTGISEVRAVRAGLVVATAPLGSDGAFSLAIPAGARTRIEFASPTAKTTLVFPRRDGSIDVQFAVGRGGAPRDLGTVERVGDAHLQTFTFGADCVDGTICIDEPDGANNQEGVDEVDGANNQCGTDEVDGANNQEGTDEPDGDNTATDESAVGDNNLPGSIGCEVIE